jgi:hypothetical protein
MTPIGADQLHPLDGVEPPRPAPWRGFDHPKRGAACVFDRVGHVPVAWSKQMRPDTGPEIPDQRPGAWAQHAADLGQTGRRVGQVVLMTRSKDRSGNASAATSPTSNDGWRWSLFSGRSALARARAIMAGSRS